MMTLEQVRAALKDRTLTKVAAATGLAYNTVLRVANAADKSVSYDVVKRLSDYLTGAAVNQNQE